MLTAASLTFLEQYHKDDNEFLSHIIQVTGDETWASFVIVETKEQSKQWMHTHSSNKLKNFKQMLSARKLVFLVHNNIFFSLLVLLTANQRLLSEYTMY
jgi:hypothetical protein